MVEERKEAILAAALAVFFRHGYRKATMNDLAKQAGVSRQTLYSHFGNKESIFVAAAELMLNTSFSRLQQALEEEGEVWERILSGFRASNLEAVQKLESSEHGEELLATRSTLLLPLIQAKEAAMSKAIAAVLRAAQAEASICIPPHTSARALADMLVFADSGFKTEATARRYQARLRTAIEVLRIATAPSH